MTDRYVAAARSTCTLDTRVRVSAARARARWVALRRWLEFAKCTPHKITPYPPGERGDFDHLVCIERPVGRLAGPHLVYSVHGGQGRAWRVAEVMWEQHARWAKRAVVYAHPHETRWNGITSMPTVSAIVGWVDAEGRHEPELGELDSDHDEISEGERSWSTTGAQER